MQSNNFSGYVAKAPVTSNHGEVLVTKFTVIANEYAGFDSVSQEKKERKVAIEFTAFGGKAEALSNLLKGDQIFLSYRIENNVYSANGVDVYGFNFIVLDFEFGAPGKLRALSPE